MSYYHFVGGQQGRKPSARLVLQFVDGLYYAGDDAEPVAESDDAIVIVGHKQALELAKHVVATWDGAPAAKPVLL